MEDRFSLLLLEPGEIYFSDVAVTYCKDPDSKEGRTPTGKATSSIRRKDSIKSSELQKEHDCVRGRLKICSKSLVFVPQESSGPSQPDTTPLIKFPLADCISIAEWLPKSFQSRLAKESHVISVTCKSRVEMLEDNKVAPFRFERVEPLVPFVFALKYKKLDDCLPLMCQLQRAATLPPVEQNGMISAIVYSTQTRTDFDMGSLESVQEKILMKTVGSKITPLVVNPGRIVLTSTTLYFQPYNNVEQNRVIKVKLTSIKRIFQRRYLLRPLGLEIEYTNAKNRSDHIYLKFGKPEERQKLYHKLMNARQEIEIKYKQIGKENFFPDSMHQTQTNARGSISLNLSGVSLGGGGDMNLDFEMDHPLSPQYSNKSVIWPSNDNQKLHSLGADNFNDEIVTLTPALHADIKEENMTLQWQNGLISNLEYLLYLNSAANRSFNDLTQYPVMPWVIQDYDSKTLELDNPKIYRDLSRPMGALNQQRLIALKERTCDMPEPKFLYGSHYSTPGFVLYFLARKIPECMLCLQNGKFDHPDRMFNSIPQTWINVTTHHSDFKELIPEFYLPENKGDFLKNMRNIEFGVRHCGTSVGDVELPPWANGPKDFVEKLAQALESEYVSRNLHSWIDLIFGYKQRGKNAELADNLFCHVCYEGSVDLDKIQDLEERHALEIQIGEFGQVPKQLFTSPHPQRNCTPSISNDSKTSEDPMYDNSGHFRKRHNRNPSDGKLTLKNLWGALEVYDEDEPDTPNANEKSNAATKVNIKPALITGQLLKTNLRMVCDYKVHREGLSTVAVSADKLWIFSASHDNILKMYSLEEMSLLRNVSIGLEEKGGPQVRPNTQIFSPPAINISCCFPLPNNKTILIGSRDNSICVYSIEYGRTYEFSNAHRDVISCMDWQNGLLATGSWDGLVKVWHCTEVNGHLVNADSDYFVAALDHTSQVSAVAICPNNSRQLVAGTRDGNVILWCLKSGAQIQELPSHARQVNGVKFSPDAKRVVSCGSDFFLKVIDIKTGHILLSKGMPQLHNMVEID